MAEQNNTPLKVGDVAPDFTLKNANNNDVALHDYRGRPVVLVFYPYDWSGTCTNEMNLLQEVLPDFEEKNATVLGISADSRHSHKAWAEQLGITFPLLADRKSEAIRAYGVQNPDGAANRATFVVDEHGKIARADVSPDRNIIPEIPKVFDALEQMEGSK
jgi:peroxiredoxin